MDNSKDDLKRAAGRMRSIMAIGRANSVCISYADAVSVLAAIDERDKLKTELGRVVDEIEKLDGGWFSRNSGLYPNEMVMNLGLEFESRRKGIEQLTADRDHAREERDTWLDRIREAYREGFSDAVRARAPMDHEASHYRASVSASYGRGR